MARRAWGNQSAPPTHDLGPLGPNAVDNGDFHAWATFSDAGVTTTSVGVPAASIPDDWYGGPGVGATARYGTANSPEGQMDVPGNPKRFLRVEWRTPPSKDWPGEAQHQPAYRVTILEYFGIRDVSRFAGQSAVLSFYARVAKGPIHVIPIVWHSYGATVPVTGPLKGRDYELFESSGQPGVVAVAAGGPRTSAICEVTEKWQRFEKVIALPETEGKTITPGHYTGVGFDFDDRHCPVLDLAQIEVRPLLKAAAK